MEDYAGRVLADRYRLPLPPADAYELLETRAFDTYSGQEVLVRQVPLPEVVDAEVVEDDGAGYTPYRAQGRATRRPADPAVRRAVEAAQAAAQIPDHPRLDQVFDVFAEAGSLWIVSELVAATPLAALLDDRPLSPYRAAEIGSDVLTALRALHAHGWTHRNITARTVLVCDDGRVVLTGLAAGAAEEALCGYAPVPLPEEVERGYDDRGGGGVEEEPPTSASATHVPGARGRTEIEATAGPERTEPTESMESAERTESKERTESTDPSDTPASPTLPGGPAASPARTPTPVSDVRAARAGAIAAYRAGARAAAQIGETGAVPVQRPVPPPPSPVPARGLGPEPHWWSQAVDDDDDDDDTDEADTTYPDGYRPEGGGPPRALLTGSWSDGPHASRDSSPPVPAGGGPALPGSGRPALPAGYAPAPVPAPAPASPDPVPASGRDGRSGKGGWGEPGEGDGGAASVYRGPATRLAGERARQARIAVVGAVTERWAPEQAGPVHENWRLAPPIGPATDLWALGALLYRAVQGHAPYPEDNAAELVQLVCAEPPAFAEECGPLRPVVESLLRQDPADRPDFEELRGWLRSLVRSAPEPEAGLGVVPLPPVDATRLPVVRRRGELVRRRRGAAAGGRHRHKKGREPRSARHQDVRHDERPDARREFRQERSQERFHEELPQRAPRPPRVPRPPRDGRSSRSPRSLGRTLLLLILLLLGGAVAYAVMFMPKEAATGGQDPAQRPTSGPTGQSAPPAGPSSEPSAKPSSGRSTPPATEPSTPALAAGYTLRKDPEGFQVGVADGWRRSPVNDAGQVRYSGGDFILIVVPGRDTVQANGSDPMAYQRTKERELQPWRDSSWSSASGLRRIDVGRQAMAVGQFTWQDSTGREVFVRNLALIDDGRYHVVQVIGPESERDKVSEIYDQAVKAYRSTR
ncbi:protein kinase [Streptomyces lateritius]|uniref:protein kinase n=1 Tax=Streptomyces lateritius TaxID=67313 RepID=UPI0016749E0B|nr:protein kinase [Streptomyces lateritius]GGT89216.1 hypothetical protein GCM10010272_37600 [Streptomyces lateritius]